MDLRLWDLKAPGERHDLGLNCKTQRTNLTGFSRRRKQFNYTVNANAAKLGVQTGSLSGVLQVNRNRISPQGMLTFVGFYIPQGRRLL
jgi:hypothetical protein